MPDTNTQYEHTNNVNNLNAVSLNNSGNTIAITDGSGLVRVYELSSNSWIQKGSDISGNVGYSVVLNSIGNMLITGNSLTKFYPLLQTRCLFLVR